MLGRRESSPELTHAADRAADVVRDYLTDAGETRALVEAAVCDLFHVLREHRWSSENALAYGKRVIVAQVAAVHHESDNDREQWVLAQLTPWLLKCYYAP